MSRWHRVASDEVWHYYEGDPLELLLADPGDFSPWRRLYLPDVFRAGSARSASG